MLTRLKLYAAAFGAFMLALGAVYWRGRSSADKAAEKERLEDYVKTRKNIDAVNLGDDPDVLRDWLRNRSQQ
jgi:hypothetical protein